MSNHKFAVGDRVFVMGAPPDVQQAEQDATYGRGAGLWHDLAGTVVAFVAPGEYVRGEYDTEVPLYRVDLDEDLEAAANHGWIVNNYTILESDLIHEAIPEKDLAEVLASIQSAAARKIER